MFSNFISNSISALQGEDANDSADEGEAPLPDQSAEGAPAAGTSDWTANLTGFASGFAKSMQLKTAEIANSVAKTDWRSELTAFTSEVKKDAATVGQEAKHVVEHLPESAHDVWSKPPQEPAGIAGAQLEEVRRFGQSLLQGTTEIFTEVSKTVAGEIEKAGKAGKREPRARAGRAAVTAVNGKYSRFETEVSAIQRDSSTYCDEPEDMEDYARFTSAFSLEERKADIDALLKGNAFMSELQTRIVPLIVEYDVFWTRYFYRVAKLQEKHEKRQALALRAQEQREEEEEIGWGDDEEESEVVAEEAPGVVAAGEALEAAAEAPLAEEAAPGASSPHAPSIHVEELPLSPASAGSSPAGSPRQQHLAELPAEAEEVGSVSSSTVQDKASTEEAIPAPAQEPQPLPNAQAEAAPVAAKPSSASRGSFDEFLSDEDDDFLTGPGPAAAGATQEDDDDDLDEDWGAS